MGKHNFREVFKGFKEATPDGKLPKINSCDPIDMTGMYELEIVKTDTFESLDAGGLSFRAEVLVISCDNGKLKPGAHGSIIIHGLTDGKDYMKAIAFGNVKGLLAACLTYLVAPAGEELSAVDESLDWDDWVIQACEDEGFLKGARFIAQVQKTAPSSRSKTGKPFGKLTCYCVEDRAEQAA